MTEPRLVGGIEVLGYSGATQRDILRCPGEVTLWLARLYYGVTRITDRGIAIQECEESGRYAIGDAILKAATTLWLPEETSEEAREAVSDEEMVRRFADRLHEIAYPEDKADVVA